MTSRINKIITWQGKEYAHIIEDEPNQFCDLCTFGDLCHKVLINQIAFENSPMKLCEELCELENTHYAMFIPAEVAETYCKHINES